MLEPIAKYGIPAILDILGPKARILEAGAGTGRISIPLLERGVDLIGCDLSSKMLHRLQEKSPSARIVQVDATHLPFPSAHFDNVLTVHVLHLIPSWREVLREFRRVLISGGAYINAKTWASVGNPVGDQLRTHWREWLAEHGESGQHPGVQDNDQLFQELRSLGAEVKEVEVVRFSDSYILREELDRFAARTYSYTWDIPESIFDPSVRELRGWAEGQFGGLDQEITDEVRFAMDVARFPG
jgi:ubiquinone/menaquinone biosynthesis C-methylase UbiE